MNLAAVLLFLGLGMFKLDKDVPIVLKERFGDAVNVQRLYAIQFQYICFETATKTFTRDECTLIKMKSDYAAYRLSLVPTSIAMCEKTNDGEYCNHAGEDLKKADFELNWLAKEWRKVENDVKNTKESKKDSGKADRPTADWTQTGLVERPASR